MNYQRLKKHELKEIISNLKDFRTKSCIKCGSNVKLSKVNCNQVICSWLGCKKRYNIWQDTIFYRSKIPKIKIFKILDLWMNNISNKHIAYILRLKNNKIVWNLLKKVSKIVVPNYENQINLIGGNDIVVEIDESKFGRRKYNKGHKVDGVWVLGMVEKTLERRIKIIAIDERTKNSLNNVINNSVDSKSIIHTDCWKGYNDLKNKFKIHNTVNHSKNFKDPETGVHTNTIEGCWYAVKSSVPIRGRTKDKITLYLTRFMLLRNEKMHPLNALIKYLF